MGFVDRTFIRLLSFFLVFLLNVIAKVLRSFRYDGASDLSSCECYDPGIDKWTAITPMGIKRSCLGEIYLNVENFLIHYSIFLICLGYS